MNYQSIWIVGLLWLGIVTTATAQRNRVHWSELDNNRGRIYQRNHIEPFTGYAYDEHAPGKKKGLIPFKEGLIDGMAVQWDYNGNKLSETQYVQGKKQGRETIFHPNGNRQSVVNYVADKVEGMVIEYFETGEKLSAGAYTLGVENGVHTWWFKNGQKDQEVPYVRGKVDGVVRQWYADGQPKMEEHFRMGVKQGITQHWYADGTVMSVQHFASDLEVDTSSYWTKVGTLKEQKIYDPSGQLVQERSFQSASIQMQGGFLQVYNELGSYFAVPVTGKNVRDVSERNDLSYFIDGHLVRLYALPKSPYIDADTDKPIDLLRAYQAYDVGNIERRYSTDSTAVSLAVATDTLTLASGEPALFWSFENPAEDSSKQLIKGEQNLVLVIGEHILLLNAIVFQKTDEAASQALLERLARGVIVAREPIDIIAVADRIRAGQPPLQP